MTLEGCVARLADVISYIGRDFDDAIRMGILKRHDLPENISSVIGSSNGTIVYNLVTDVIENSFRQPYAGFSREVSEALVNLKAFNMTRIYKNPAIKRHLGNVKELFYILFDRYLEDLEKGNEESSIFSGFLEDMSENYISTHSKPEIVRDFIAGMTDHYFIAQCPEKLRPSIIDGFHSDIKSEFHR
jgi:dGTPase